jgi:hypothetical protein
LVVIRILAILLALMPVGVSAQTVYTWNMPAGVIYSTVLDNGSVRLWNDQGAQSVYPDTFGVISKDGKRRTIASNAGGVALVAMTLARHDAEIGREVRLLCDMIDPFVSYKQGCVSASTVWITGKTTCIGRDAVFHFHGVGNGLGGAAAKDMNEYIAREAYGPVLSRWYLEHGSTRGFMGIGIKRMTAARVHELTGIGYCE